MTKRCSGITSKHAKCKRKIDNGNFCWQHKQTNNKTKESKLIVPKEKNRNKKCRIFSCDSKPISKNHSYCSSHNCSYTNCKNFSGSKRTVCFQHKCKVYLCNESCLAGKDHCGEHKCQMKGCNESLVNARKKHGYCCMHTCEIKGCMLPKNESSKEGKYCNAHKTQFALEKPEECSVCLEEFDEKEEPWPCGHYVHRKCITQSMKAECPLCRKQLRLLPIEHRLIEQNRQQVQVQQVREQTAATIELINRLNFEEARHALLDQLNFEQTLSMLRAFIAQGRL